MIDLCARVTKKAAWTHVILILEDRWLAQSLAASGRWLASLVGDGHAHNRSNMACTQTSTW
jgi:hypothetical protein